MIDRIKGRLSTQLICQKCGREAPTKLVAFGHTIGIITTNIWIWERSRSCKSCMHRAYWKNTLKCLTIGWWGYLTIFLTPAFVAANTAIYIGLLFMKPRSPNATQPTLTSDEEKVLEPFRQEFVDRMSNEKDIDAIAIDFAKRTNLTPGQIIVHMEHLLASGQYEEAYYAPFTENPDPEQKAWW